MSAFWPFYEVETPRIPYKYWEFLVPHHIIPSDDRELQLKSIDLRICFNHIIPSDDRELQREVSESARADYHIIPSDDRELQPVLRLMSVVIYHIIPSDDRELQRVLQRRPRLGIISYQVMTGNYSASARVRLPRFIISYQVMTGNYS